MLTDLNQSIISQYSPISAKGGRRAHGRKYSRKQSTRRHKKSKSRSKNARSRRRYR